MLSQLRSTKIIPLAYREWRLTLSTPQEVLLPIFESFLYLLIFASIMGTVLAVVIYEGIEYSYLTFILPGILTMAAFQRGIHAGTPIYVARITGELETMFGLPVRRTLFLFSTIGTVVIQGLLCSIVLIVVGNALSPDFPWNFPRLLLAMGVASLLTVSCAFAFAAVCSIIRQQQTFNLLINLVTLPLILTSSAFYPLDHAPAWVRLISSINPVNLTVDLIRRILLAPQFHLSDLVSGILPLVAIGLTAGALASYFFDRTLK